MESVCATDLRPQERAQQVNGLPNDEHLMDIEYTPGYHGTRTAVGSLPEKSVCATVLRRQERARSCR